MNKLAFTSVVVGLMVVCGIGCASETSSVTSGGGGGTPGQAAPAVRADPFTRKVPEDVAAQIRQAVSHFETERPLTASQRGKVCSAVEALDLTKPSTLRREQEETLHAIGDAAIPVLVEMLADHRTAIRQKACYAAFLLHRPRERITPDYKQTEAALIALFRRSLLDESPEVRSHAVAGLHVIAFARFPKVPQEVAQAILEMARKDPNPKVRDDAEFYAKRLGIIKD